MFNTWTKWALADSCIRGDLFGTYASKGTRRPCSHIAYQLKGAEKLDDVLHPLTFAHAILINSEVSQSKASGRFEPQKVGPIQRGRFRVDPHSVLLRSKEGGPPTDRTSLRPAKRSTFRTGTGPGSCTVLRCRGVRFGVRWRLQLVMTVVRFELFQPISLWTHAWIYSTSKLEAASPWVVFGTNMGPANQWFVLVCWCLY